MQNKLVELTDFHMVDPDHVEAVNIKDRYYCPAYCNYSATEFWHEVQIYLSSGSVLKWKFPYDGVGNINRPEPNTKQQKISFKKAKKFQKELLIKLGKTLDNKKI